jgi:MoaA/NifB/PqqE/SkfB family radical SAM enzyme
MGTLSGVSRKARSVREFIRGFAQTDHPLLVQIIPIRRCNIDCGYCNEYDKVSPPVPTGVMKHRIDKLKGLGTSVVAFSGGEPMLHPTTWSPTRCRKRACAYSIKSCRT